MDEVPGQESPGTAESSISAGMGGQGGRKGQGRGGTLLGSSVMPARQGSCTTNEESAEQLPPPVEPARAPGRLEPPAPPS